MKKYICIYIVILSVVMLMIVTNGIGYEIILNTSNEVNKEIVDGFLIQNSLLIYNIIIVFLLIIISVVVTLHKKNDLKSKYVILLVTILLMLFIPIGIHSSSGGIAGKTSFENIALKDFYKIFY